MYCTTFWSKGRLGKVCILCQRAHNFQPCPLIAVTATSIPESWDTKIQFINSAMNIHSELETYLRSCSKASVLLIDTSRLSGWIRLNISTTGMLLNGLADIVFTRTRSSHGTSSRKRSLNDEYGTLWRRTLMACKADRHVYLLPHGN